MRGENKRSVQNQRNAHSEVILSILIEAVPSLR